MEHSSRAACPPPAQLRAPKRAAAQLRLWACSVLWASGTKGLCSLTGGSGGLSQAGKQPRCHMDLWAPSGSRAPSALLAAAFMGHPPTKTSGSAKEPQRARVQLTRPESLKTLILQAKVPAPCLSFCPCCPVCRCWGKHEEQEARLRGKKTPRVTKKKKMSLLRVGAGRRKARAQRHSSFGL